MNRKKRKNLVRILTIYYGLEKIPCARKDAIDKFWNTVYGKNIVLDL